MAAGDASSTFTIEVEVDAASATRSAASFFSAFRGATTGLDTEVNKIEKAALGAANSQQKLASNLSTTRYALYDVASTLAITGTALLGLSVGAAAVAIAWERDFAQVVRTTGVVGDEVDELRAGLVDLAQTMPVAFGDVAQIATLAGQLGVAEDRVQSFTETTIKFSTVTDLTVDAAATAFGRLDALLPDVQGNYEGLGSAIAKVGVNSVATESQITAISTQISSMGAFAGLTADEVIGLSGALASVGAAPELSRGTVTRVFTQMSKAVAEGGESVERFAKIAGVSGAEFEAAFGTEKFGPIFQNFIKGLDDTERTGGNAVRALEELGITSVRDVPLLLRLAGANDVVARSFADAKTGFEEGSELNRQYGVIAETTAAKLQILVNNFMALLDAIGSSTTGPIGMLADHFTDLLGVITDIVSSPFGQWVAGTVIALSAIVGVMALVGAAFVAGYAGIIAIQQALVGLTGASGVASVGVRGLAEQLKALGGAGAVAATGLKVVTGAMKLLGAALIIFAGIEIGSAISKGLGDIAYAMNGLERDTDSAYKRLLASATQIEKFGNIEVKAPKNISNFFQMGDAIGSLNRALAPLSGETILRDLVQVDEALADMIANGHADDARQKLDELRKSWVDGGGSVSSFKTAYTDATTALRDYTVSQNAANYEAARGRETADLLAASEEVAEQRATDLAAAIGVSTEELAALQENVQSGSAAWFDWAGNVKAAYEEGGGGIQQFMATLDEQIAGQQVWADNLAILTAQGATSFVSELAKMGPAGQQLAADAVNLTSEELMKLESQARLAAFLASDAFAAGFTDNIPLMMAAYEAGGLEAVQALIDAQISEAPGAVESVISAYNIQLDGNKMKLQADASAVDQEAQRAVNRVNGMRATISIDVIANYSSGAQQVIRNPTTYGGARATGGPIYGPGSGTSDDIMIRASNGEYMMKTAAHNYYGTAFMNAINSMKIPKFASGGPISGSSNGGGGGGFGGIVELGPKSLSRLSSSILVQIGDEEISRASQRGDAKRRSNGDL